MSLTGTVFYGRIVLLVPCLRATFDALATLLLLHKFWRHFRGLRSEISIFLITEEIKDITLIFGIMAMEAVFVQIPSPARAHARNFIIPFVDSLTAILTTRFVMEVQERSRSDCEDSNTKILNANFTRVRDVEAPDTQSPKEVQTQGSSIVAFELDRAWNRVCELDILPHRRVYGSDWATRSGDIDVPSTAQVSRRMKFR
ncbi:hypothetical protein MVEN_02402700 [Mycena venus]|uniref:Uncharacterized protein n=1 Tax=Mycena venus TaxID=2733690 RepID=A0A8H7CEX1_9AGAR|nr:hypothetical protein MVEN_02402700 [Mycena venus]